MKRIIFFLGKGGVGKSTMAVLGSIYHAARGGDVLLASLDPAHNLSHILDRKLSVKPKKVASRLSVLEVDPKRLTRAYLKSVEDDLRRTYSYQTAFNLTGYFKLIRHSPGIEEHALIRAFQDIVNSNDSKDLLIFDMPPTALTLKFFRLPTLSLLWLEHLRALRETIIKKNEMITAITLGKREYEGDRILRRIDRSLDEYRNIEGIFKDSGRISVRLVLNPDRLSVMESRAIKSDLSEMGISVDMVILNRCDNSDEFGEDARAFGHPVISLPLSCEPLIGLPALCRYIEMHRDSFDAMASE